jgi:hypothetical protein
MFPDKLPSREEMTKAVAGAGFDGILVATYRRIKERVYSEPYGPDVWGGVYGWGMGEEPVVDESVVFVTTLWDPKDAKVLWTANTETENPSSGRDFVNSLRKAIIPKMAAAGVIPPKPSSPVARR